MWCIFGFGLLSAVPVRSGIWQEPRGSCSVYPQHSDDCILAMVPAKGGIRAGEEFGVRILRRR